jgi:gamma-glutamyltranspeptidase / glutathione hydrolase
LIAPVRAVAPGGAKFTTRPEIIGTFGAVSSTHWLASAVGMSILERGGNAFDAAVATGFTLQIVEPHLSGPAGDMPAILYSARDRAVRVLCAQGVAPKAATIAKFRELGLAMIPGTGFLAAAVPGAFDGWMLLLRDYGTMAIDEVLAPAIAYAESGFPVLPRVTMSLLPLAVFQSGMAKFGRGVVARRSTAETGDTAPNARGRRRLQTHSRRSESSRRRAGAPDRRRA